MKNDKGRMDPGNLRFHLREKVPTTHVGVRVRVCGKKRIDGVVLKIDGQPARNLTDPDGDRAYEVKFAATAQDIRNMRGKKVQLCVTSGGIQQCTDGQVTIDPEGWVFDLVNSTLGEGARMAALQSQPQSPGRPFVLWDAAAYGQVNPQQTGPDGHFAFFTPPGTYRLQVTKVGYQPYLSPDLT
ncbi:MAG TPA: carboxypeptidase regulatory-like domain-containing protein, partial [Anaerolineae bacterium]|nr:carboxypeptidase regulatory-like domain-containing protein [Anaerolineae bacterium]